jgi:hypothetical protein
MSNNQNSVDDVQLDQLLVQASKAQRETGTPTYDELLKARILAALPTDAVPTTTTSWLDIAWQWFAQPMRLAAAAALPLLVGFALGNATLITDNELLIALSEQESWPLEQMLDDTTWSDANE